MSIHEWDDAARSIQNAAAAGLVVYVRDSAVTHKRELTWDNPRRGSLPSDLLQHDGANKVATRSDVIKGSGKGGKYRRMGLGDYATAKERILGAADKKRLSQILTDAMSGKAGLL